MKVVINACFGGFSLSPLAVKRLAELQGRQCFFFCGAPDKRYGKPLAADSLKGRMFWNAFDIPNPDEVLLFMGAKEWASLTQEERVSRNRAYEKHNLTSRPDNRADPLLVQVVEELGEAANGEGAALKIVEIPDGVEYEIAEYDGSEHIAEAHRTWS